MQTSSIAELEAGKYHRAWEAPEYRVACHSLSMWQEHRELFPEFASALDIGCGLGLMIDTWNRAGIDAWGCDIAGNCLDPLVSEKWGHKFRQGLLWTMRWSKPFDFSICADVMEHIPPEHVQGSLERIAACCDEVLFKIDHAHNSFGGDVLHLTLHPVEWWLRTINGVGGSAEFVGTASRGGGIKGSMVRWRIR